MPHFPLPDDLNDDPTLAGLSDAALALWTRAASWSAHRLTDGHVPTSMVVRFSRAGTDAADELVESGAWKRARGGWQFAAFPDAAKKVVVDGKRETDRLRQQRHRRSRDKASRRDNVVTHASVTHEVTGEVTDDDGTRDLSLELPGISSPPTGEKKKSGRKEGGSGGKPAGPKPKVPMPADWAPTDNHAAFCTEHGLDLDHEARQFRFKSEAEDWRYASWNGGFSTWLGNQAKWAKERPARLRSVPGGYRCDSRGRRTEVG